MSPLVTWPKLRTTSARAKSQEAFNLVDLSAKSWFVRRWQAFSLLAVVLYDQITYIITLLPELALMHHPC